jgi:hypothetical protein
MINEVRNTVMFILNKDNNGYISPEAFNDFARMAQLEVVKELFDDYNKAMVKMNNRVSGSNYGDIPKNIKETLDRFMVFDTILEFEGTENYFILPSNADGNLVDLNDYQGAGFDEYDNSIDWDWYRIMHVEYNSDTEVERVEKKDIRRMLNSKLMAPSVTFPVYTLSGNKMYVYPSTIQANVMFSYLRYPRDPKWTWQTLSGGEPLFHQSATDYQDFELPISEMPILIVKICRLAGVEIREADVVQVMNAQETYHKQLEQ